MTAVVFNLASKTEAGRAEQRMGLIKGHEPITDGMTKVTIEDSQDGARRHIIVQVPDDGFSWLLDHWQNGAMDLRPQGIQTLNADCTAGAGLFEGFTPNGKA